MFIVYKNGEFEGIVGCFHFSINESKWYICRNTKDFIDYRPVGILNPKWREELVRLGYEIKKERNFDINRLPNGY